MNNNQARRITGPQKTTIMKIEVTMKSGQIFKGEFQTKMSSLLWIEVPANEVNKNDLAELLAAEIPGLYSLKQKNDGGLEITLSNSEVEKVVVE